MQKTNGWPQKKVYAPVIQSSNHTPAHCWENYRNKKNNRRKERRGSQANTWSLDLWHLALATCFFPHPVAQSDTESNGNSVPNLKRKPVQQN